MKLQNRRLMLCFQEPEEELSLALAYWERMSTVTGGDTWTVKTAELGTTINKVITSVRAVATAYDVNSRCPSCEKPEEITSRSTFASARHSTFRRDRVSGQLLCPACAQSRAAEHAAAAELERREREQQLRTTVANYRPKAVPLAELDLSVQMLLLAVLRAADADSHGHYKLTGDVVADGTNYLILEKLRSAGAICWVADEKLTGWSLVDGQVYVNSQTVRWRPTFLESYGEATAYLASQAEVVAGDADALVKLWRIVALTECRGHLQGQAEHFRLGDLEIGEKTEAAIWYALNHFSIAQVWGIINNASQYAAAQRQARTKVAAYAAKLIPGSIMGYVDRAVANQWTVYPRSRPSWHDEPTLTSLLFDRVLAGVSTFQQTTTATLASMRNAPL